MDVNGLVFNSQFIPREIVTHILDFVDLRHVIFQCRTVCKNWNDIVTGELWKKKLAERKGLKSFSTLSVRERFDLKYPWFILYKIFLNDPFSRNLMENAVDLGKDLWKRELIDLKKCGISSFMICLQPKITVNIRVPVEDGPNISYKYRVVIKLRNQFHEVLHKVAENINNFTGDWQCFAEVVDYHPTLRYIEVFQLKLGVTGERFLLSTANVDIQLALPEFPEKERNKVGNDKYYQTILQAKNLKSFSKINGQLKANLHYPWFIAREIIIHDPYEKDLVTSKENLFYEGGNELGKFGFWRVVTENLSTPDSPFLNTRLSKMYLVQTICLRDHGIFDFILDSEQPSIKVNITYPDFGSTTLFEWHLYHRIKVSLLNDKEEVLHDKSVYEENRREESTRPLEIDWIFEKYGAGVRYIELRVGCKFVESPYPYRPKSSPPSLKATVSLPQMKKS